MQARRSRRSRLPASARTAAVLEDPFPVEWMGHQAVVALPEHIDVSNVGQIREELLSVINRGAAVLIADMTATVSCDHAGADAVARAFEAAIAAGTPATDYPAQARARAQTDGKHRPGPSGTRAAAITPAVLWQLIDALGDGLALTAGDGQIVLVNRRLADMFGSRRREARRRPCSPSGRRQEKIPVPVPAKMRDAACSRGGVRQPVLSAVQPARRGPIRVRPGP